MNKSLIDANRFYKEWVKISSIVEKQVEDKLQSFVTTCLLQFK